MHIRYIDLFCGIGGFRLGVEQALESRAISGECVFSSDIDAEACRMYTANFNETPFGDISRIPSESIPRHDLLLAGFPCQPFSIMGSARGFEDTRGTLFFEIARILEALRPTTFILENVKQLVGHDRGRTLSRILETVDNLGYWHTHRVLNALDFGLPQKRERLIIVGSREPLSYAWPSSPIPMTPLAEILEQEVPTRYYASDRIRNSRSAACRTEIRPSIWHENKAGHVSAYPYSCALRAGASYNYLLVNGERRLTPREMLRLQGFPDDYRIVSPEGQVRKQCGNAVPVPIVRCVAERLFDALEWSRDGIYPVHTAGDQRTLALEDRCAYG